MPTGWVEEGSDREQVQVNPVSIGWRFCSQRVLRILCTCVILFLQITVCQAALFSILEDTEERHEEIQVAR